MYLYNCGSTHNTSLASLETYLQKSNFQIEMSSLRCNRKQTESTIKDYLKDNKGSLKTVDTTETSVTNSWPRP